MPNNLQDLIDLTFFAKELKKISISSKIVGTLNLKIRSLNLAKRKMIYNSLQNAKATFDEKKYSKKCNAKMFFVIV